MKKLVVLLFLLSGIISAQCPSVTVTPISQTYTCNGAPLTFTAIFSPTTNVVGKWIGPGGSQISVTATSPSVLKISNPGTYTFEATHTISTCSAAQTVSINASTVIPTMTIVSTNSLAPYFEINCVTGTPSYSIQTSLGPAPTSYSWTNLSTSVTTTPANSAYTITSAGDYYAEFVNGNGCKIGQQISVLSNTIPPNGTVNPTSGTLTCLTTVNSFTAISTPTNINVLIQWFSPPGVPLGPVASSPSPMIMNSQGTYTVYFTDILSGCVNQQTVSVLSNTLSPVLNITGNSTVCLGTSANFTVSGANTYSWSTGAFTNTLNVLPTSSSIYSVSGTGPNGCVGTNTVSVFTNTTCSDVWPGDANSDGVANKMDILEIGLQFSSTGPSRSLVTNNWVSCFANNWTGLISTGKNKCHSDCNGDGVVNINDTIAVSNNFALTHSFKLKNEAGLNPDLFVVPDQSLLQIGKWGTASVYLGDATKPITNIHGIAFDLNFDKNLIETDSVYFEYINSFVNAGITNIQFQKRSFVNGVIYAADTRTNQVNVSGNGKIGVLHFKAATGLTNDALLNLSTSNITKTDATSNFTALTGGATSLTITTSAIGVTENELNLNHLKLFPNPNSGSFTLQTKEDVVLEVINELGQTVKTIKLDHNNNHQSTITGLASGVYCIKDNVSGKVIQNKIVVVK